jgi:putative ABC transport system permease protein
MTTYSVEGRPAPDPASTPQSLLHFVTPDYFRTMRIPLLQGRDFTDRDDLQAPLVAIVNETLAKRAWPGESPIGRRLVMPDAPGPATVVAVVGDAKHYSAADPATAQIYVSHFQVPLIFCSLVARTSVPPLTIANDVRRAIWSVDKDQPVWAVWTLEQQLARTQGQSHLAAVLLGVFAGIALLLAAVGIYGVTSYAVAQRTHEIGIRLALGASGGRVRQDIMRHAIKLTAGAVAVGIACAIGSARLAGAMLVGVEPTDPAALVASAAVLAAVSIAAAYVPARRASRVDPVVALADE